MAGILPNCQGRGESAESDTKAQVVDIQPRPLSAALVRLAAIVADIAQKEVAEKGVNRND